MHRKYWSIPRLAAAGVVAIAALAVASTAEAQSSKKSEVAGGGSDVITGSSFDAILASLERAGFTVRMSKDSDGDPMIESTDSDDPFLVYFYECTAGKDCGYMQFREGWDLKNGTTTDVVEKWNEDRVWGRAWLDSDNDPWIDMTVNLRGGITAANLDDTASWWWSVLRDFEDHIGFNK